MIVKKVANTKTGSSKAARISGVANYITEPERANGLEKCIHHEAINFLTDTHEAQVAEMIALAQDAVRSKDPIDHWVLSWPAAERPTIDQVREAVMMFAAHCGLKGHQMIWGLHDDTQNLHVHIAINRVHPDSLKVIEINKGFQLNAAHQAIALIEKKQGWQSTAHARYKTNDLGELITDNTTKQPLVITKNQLKTKTPTAAAQDKEIQTGQKSAQRLAIEAAPQIISRATSWLELHTLMAQAGLEYRREGSGAKIFVGDIGVKASDVVDRKHNFGALQKRLGLYQPAHQPEIRDDPHHRTQLITNPFESDFEPIRFGTLNRLRHLSSSHLAVNIRSTKNKPPSQGVLQSHESADRRTVIGMRRGSHRDRAEKGAGRQSTGNVLVQPLTSHQPGWLEYREIKAAQDTAKNTEQLALVMRHTAERAVLQAAQKAHREAVLKLVPKGNGAILNVARSALALEQAPERLELQERQREERQALQARYKALPSYKVWREQPLIVSVSIQPLIDQQRERDRTPRRVSQILKALTSRVDARHHITYQLYKSDVFRDEGHIIHVLDVQSDVAIICALAFAQQKFGPTLTLTGSVEFQKNVVALAVANSLTCRFADPALDKLRERMQQQKDVAAREATPVTPALVAAEAPSQVTTAPPVRVQSSVPPAREAEELPFGTPRSHQGEPELLSQPTAQQWIDQQSKRQARPYATGDAKVKFTVVYIGANGIVLDHGRDVAIYPLPEHLTLQLGDQVVLDKDGTLHWPYVPEQGDGKKAVGR